ncbi:alpha/beta hydrolase [Paenibacillus apiarius]|uniref:Alpha/beta fold hydrolase n=1 Tax=Paenibacillus apiarius TaxID=46240 RepID=A0ABT4DXA4_9BACL|nr:alpha/beta fold hydrolase [Paenibacillus apiarius]MCY9515689.1 alpha/beta fold hydrolase [Paenibacillus apiarius]MCY9521978.1 alpha/beta fold hydrolase [Paenibacillus apiarius]MCY9550524.1 alpha/beta fold hydrolase [Paenibacillus apiarius]MCY9559827.1 alpha/beta fold hydrolase [Paenibacillus apiarius]MCY9683489.1 alpha/beta fold hydrolase [Paenibacillus apiarius]
MNTPIVTSPPLHPEWFAPSGSAPAAARRIRLKHVAIALSLSTVFAALLIFLALHGFIAWMFANPQVPPLFSNPMEAKGMRYDTIAFPAKDGHTLVDGWYIPSDKPSKRTIIFSHGYGANREEYWVPMYDLAQFAHRLDYNVVMFDYGFASEQHKTKATGGRLEKEQLLGAVQLAKERGAEHVVVWGFSMGAGTALQASLLSQDIDAMILDSTFLLEPDTLYHNLTQYISLPKHPSLDLLRAFFPALNGTSLQQIPYNEVKATNYAIPTFFIHGTADTKAPYEIAEQLAARQSNKLSESWVVPDVQHELIYRTHRKEYLGKAAAFLNAAYHTDKGYMIAQP